MENKQIKELMAAMARCGTTKLHIKTEEFELDLERKEEVNVQKTMFLDDLDDSNNRFANQPPKSNAPLPKGNDMMPVHPTFQPTKEESAGSFITSPMVGTFYSSPSPEDPPFVKIGEKIEKGDVICIVEAMKVMNEIKAQAAGTLLDVLVESGTPVEFGTKLFRFE